MKQMKLFIWDFDGTLMDTYPNIIRYLRQALQEFGKDASAVEIMEKMMDTILSTIEFYSKQYGIPNLHERYKAHYAREAQDPVLVFPGVPEVLQEIRRMGADNYIFTNRGESIYPMLEKAGVLEEFTEIVTAASPEFVVKPSPDVILYLMKKYGGTPENTVMIGDRVCDLESAYRAGCRTCHLLTPSVPQYPECDWRIENLFQMLDMLRA